VTQELEYLSRVQPLVPQERERDKDKERKEGSESKRERRKEREKKRKIRRILSKNLMTSSSLMQSFTNLANVDQYLPCARH
jgi:hypothetical protein